MLTEVGTYENILIWNISKTDLIPHYPTKSPVLPCLVRHSYRRSASLIFCWLCLTLLKKFRVTEAKSEIEEEGEKCSKSSIIYNINNNSNINTKQYDKQGSTFVEKSPFSGNSSRNYPFSKPENENSYASEKEGPIIGEKEQFSLEKDPIVTEKESR